MGGVAGMNDGVMLCGLCLREVHGFMDFRSGVLRIAKGTSQNSPSTAAFCSLH